MSPRGRLGARRRRPPRSRLAARARRPQRAGAAAVVAHRPQGRRRRSASAGWPSPTSPPSTAPRRTSWTRTTSGPAPVRSATRSPPTTSTTPARRSCAPPSPAGSPRRGCRLDVCSGGRADGRAAGGLRPGPDRLPRQQQVGRRAARAVVDVGVGRIIVDSFDEIDAARSRRRASSASSPAVMVRVTAGVEAHTHEYIATAHEDQKFGFSITSRRRARGGAPGADADPGSSCSGCTRHIGSQIFDTAGFEVAARRVLALHARVARRARRRAAGDGPRRRLRHRLHHPGRPGRARRSWPRR